MDTEKLMIFLQKILENGSGSKSQIVLEQLKEIMEMQSVSPDLIAYVEDAIYALPEAMDIAVSETITPVTLEKAKRLEQKRRQELEMRDYGRC